MISPELEFLLDRYLAFTSYIGENEALIKSQRPPDNVKRLYQAQIDKWQQDRSAVASRLKIAIKQSLANNVVRLDLYRLYKAIP